MDQLKSKYLKNLRHVIFGGEFLSHELVKKLMHIPKNKILQCLWYYRNSDNFTLAFNKKKRFKLKFNTCRQTTS